MSPSPHEQPPGRAAFEIASAALADEEVQYQSTLREIKALYMLGSHFVDISCGHRHSPIRSTGQEHHEYFTASVGQHNSRSFSIRELAEPGGIDAFMSSAPPSERTFRPGQEPEGDLSDAAFERAMQRVESDLAASTVQWIHEALRIVQLPREHSSVRDRVDELVRQAEDADDVPLLLTASVDMKHVRSVSGGPNQNTTGWAISATWSSANQAVLERNRYNYLTKTRIILARIPTDGQQFCYERDIYDNEALVAEVKDPGEREVLQALGYEVYEPRTWRMWGPDIAEQGVTPPPDTALLDFANRLQRTLRGPRMGNGDRFTLLPDGTIKALRPDGTTY